MRAVTYSLKTSPTKSHDLLMTWSHDKLKPYICTSAIPMVTKLGRVVTCGGKTVTSKSCDLLSMWTRDK